MKNICVIGSLGKLGSELVKHPAAIECPWQFQDSVVELKNWFEKHPEIDTVWHVARACRTEVQDVMPSHFCWTPEGLLKF